MNYLVAGGAKSLLFLAPSPFHLDQDQMLHITLGDV